MKIKGTLSRLYLYKAEWSIVTTGTNAGSFKLRINGEVTSEFDETASGADIQTAIEALDGFSAGDVTVTGTAGTATTFTLTFIGDYLYSGAEVEATDIETGATVTISRSVPASVTTTDAVVVGNETSLDTTMNIETDDVTNKDSDSWSETDSQVRGIEYSAENVYSTTDTFTALQNQVDKRLPVIVLKNEAAQTVGGDQMQTYSVCTITSLSQSAEYGADVRFSLALSSTGEPTRITT